MGYDFRDAVFESVRDVARRDRNTIVLTNDMGAMGLDQIRSELPTQVVNVGIAEQNMMSVAGGLASAGKSVFVYGICAHITARCFEQIKIDICVPDLPVVLLGVGAGLSYGVDGPTHHGVEDIAILRTLANLTIYNPADVTTAGAAVALSHSSRRPSYVRMDKEQLDELYDRKSTDFRSGIGVVAEGKDVAIVATGVHVWAARAAARTLAKDGISVRVIDLYRLKPVDTEGLAKLLADVRVVLTVEENVATGGVGTIVAETLGDHSLRPRLRRMSLGDQFLLGSASREWAAEKFGLSQPGIEAAVRKLFATSRAS